MVRVGLVEGDGHSANDFMWKQYSSGMNTLPPGGISIYTVSSSRCTEPRRGEWMSCGSATGVGVAFPVVGCMEVEGEGRDDIA